MSMPDRAQAEQTGPEPISVSGTFTKLWQGAKRTWKLYRRSKMGMLGLGIVMAFVIMAVFAPLISPYSPDFRAPSSDIFIADRVNLPLPEVKNWTKPMGLPTAATGNALKRIMIYSDEGDTYIYPVTQGLSNITGESGIKIDTPKLYHLLPNLTYINYVMFKTGFPAPIGDPLYDDIRGSFFFMLQNSTLHEYESNLVDSTKSWNIGFAPLYHSNLWNGFLSSANGRIALAFANESTVWLLSMRPAVSLFDDTVRSYTSSVSLPDGAKIVSSPIVMDTNLKNSSALAVPTDKGLYVYSINVRTVTIPMINLSYVIGVSIGNLLWSNDYHISDTDIVTPIATPAAITFPNPADATSTFGKTNILLATQDGRIVSYDTFNGTIKRVSRVVMPTVPAYTITGIFPSTAGVTVVGEVGPDRGFIAGIDPNFLAVLNNNTAYAQTDGLLSAQPDYSPRLRKFLFSTDREVIYLTNELMTVYATFTVPGGMTLPVSYQGNIYIADSETGNYFGTITGTNSLYVETLSGVNIAPLPPGTYPSGNRYILGTDYEGHDILSWLIYGTRSELLVGVTAAIFAVVIGTIVGLVAGYYSGLVDDLLMRATDVVLSLPFIVIALLFASVFGPLLVNIIIIIAVLSWAGIARVIRSVTLSLKERSFVDAAIIAGASESRIIFRHIAPNVLPYTFLYMTFTVSGAIITEAILAFLGFGDPSNVTWGMMLQFLQISGHSLDAPWWLLPPGIAITLLSLSFYLIGRAFDEVVNPRLRGR